MVLTVTPATTVMERACAGEVVLALSFTVTLKDEVPAVEALPVMAPVEAFKDRPTGNDPVVTVQLL